MITREHMLCELVSCYKACEIRVGLERPHPRNCVSFKTIQCHAEFLHLSVVSYLEFYLRTGFSLAMLSDIPHHQLLLIQVEMTPVESFHV